MRRSLPKRSNLFLMEMILAILFFSLASAVCMQLFVKARVLSRNTSAANHAMVLAKSAASAFESSSGDLEDLQKDYPKGSLNASVLEIYYDKNWNPCDKKDSEYTMSIALDEQNGNLSTALITVNLSDKTELFSLKASCYRPREVPTE